LGPALTDAFGEGAVGAELGRSDVDRVVVGVGDVPGTQVLWDGAHLRVLRWVWLLAVQRGSRTGGRGPAATQGSQKIVPPRNSSTRTSCFRQRTSVPS